MERSSEHRHLVHSPEKTETTSEKSYEFLSAPEMRDRLGKRIVQLAEKVKERHIDMLFFLDKSARPFAWLFRDVWKRSYPDVPPPETRFTNIGLSTGASAGFAENLLIYKLHDDKELQGKIVGAAHDDEWISNNDVPWLKYCDAYITPEKMPRETQFIKEFQATFAGQAEGKKVLFIDDFSVTGNSALCALLVGTLALPKAREVSTTPLFTNVDPSREPDPFSTKKKTDSRTIVPWSKSMGMAGVVELPESLLFTAPLNRDTVEKVSEAYAEQEEKQWEKLQKDLQPIGISLQNIELSLKKGKPLKDLSAENKRDVLAFTSSLVQLSGQKDKKYVDSANTINQSFDKILEKEVAVQSFFKLSNQKNHEPVWKTIGVIMDVLSSIKRLKTLSKIRTELDPEELIRSTRQLRKELQWLAQDLVPSKISDAPAAV